jgi:D-tyrosyl-tRNA(Tyr) deacylase
MKLVIQRVNKAVVTRCDTGVIVGKINRGLFVLLGIKKGDGTKEVNLFVEKLIKLRVMSDETGKMNLSVLDTGSKILVVSQFTLYANTTGGNRPSFIDAEDPGKALQLYEYFIEKLKELGAQVETGSFGNYMNVDLVLDGPVTIILENP